MIKLTIEVHKNDHSRSYSVDVHVFFNVASLTLNFTLKEILLIGDAVSQREEQLNPKRVKSS